MGRGFRCIAPVVVLLVTLLQGCASKAPQAPVALSAKAVSAGNGRVGVAMSRLPRADTYLPGAGCLLCMAAASIANSSMTDYAKTLPLEDLPKLKQDVAALLRKGGAEVVVIDDDLNADSLPKSGLDTLNFSPRDFGALKTKYTIDHLLVMEINMIGFERTYQSYIPSSEPKAVIRGRGYMVNLANNEYEWYLPVDILRSAEGRWDEPPRFPGLSNAYFQTVELGRDAFLGPFGK